MTNPKVDRYGNVFHFDDENRFHCENDPAIEWQTGLREWYFHGKLHREGGPAREMKDRINEWFFEGLPHRGDGPAIIRPSGAEEWWYFGTRVPDSPFLQKLLASPSKQVAPRLLKEVSEKLLVPLNQQIPLNQQQIQQLQSTILQAMEE